MDEPNVSGEAGAAVAIFTDGWEAYQRQISAALAPLSPEQLALRVAPDLRSIGELACHIIGVRAAWFHVALGIGDAEFAAFQGWNRAGPVSDGAELARGMTATWEVIRRAVADFTLADLQAEVTGVRNGEPYRLQRGWIVWHVLEHDLHHGGELSFSLGAHGLHAPDF